MKFDWGFNFDLHDLFVGVLWSRGEAPISRKLNETGNHGSPEYEFPIYQILVVNVNPLPFCNFHVVFMWGASV
jgi:hypothetical protein